MKKILTIPLAASCLISTLIHAQPTFSPYADLTINAHWDSNTQDMEPMDLAAISKESGIKDYHLAFLTDSGNCNPAWGSQSSYSLDKSWGKHLTDKMHAQGIQSTVALGGANGTDISKNCSVAQLETIFTKTIQTYQVSGLDFDIENGTANVPKIMQALKTTQAAHPKIKLSFTLPVMPEGLTASGKDIVQQAKDANLKFTVNIMAMDYGPAYPNNMGAYAVQAATNLFQFLKTLYPQKADKDLWQMVEVTPMIGVNDVNVEQFTLSDADALRDFALKNNLAGLSMWSVARDNPCADAWASPICSGKNLQTQQYEFAKHFLG